MKKDDILEQRKPIQRKKTDSPCLRPRIARLRRPDCGGASDPCPGLNSVISEANSGRQTTRSHERVPTALAVLLISALGVILTASASAECARYPTRPIRLIVGFPP